MNKKVLISTDKELIDIDFVVNYLSNESYWANERNPERIKTSINNSMCFSVCVDEKQIGFARVLTDFGVFAWIMDLFISPKHQGKGYGKLLMNTIVNHSQLQNISRWGLNTIDAHGLYQKSGFNKIQDPNLYMERLVKQE
ncbi:GNAT family N-acetyltransferase [Tenacibaculum ovolyticum]|uniref:GNAT family N-acetyltransferase n=1 Tax=Tenacibaculum ovolyticum TaxID=104270 RepID=UPI001F37782E|nr:GNAT family N-acetyltransferase [Tenacibaculum ovolyticum]